MAPPAVIDTNVLIAGLLARDPQSPPVRIVDGMLARDFRYLLSLPLLVEYRSVLLRARVRQLHGLGDAEIDGLLEALVANALLQEPISALDEDPPDPGDRHLWLLLGARPGALLVTGDTALLRNPPSFASVVSPATFIGLTSDPTP